MNQHKVECFWGEQETHYDLEKTVSVKTEADDVKIAVITAQNKIITEPSDSVNLQIDSAISSVGPPPSESLVQTTSTTGARTMNR